MQSAVLEAVERVVARTGHARLRELAATRPEYAERVFAIEAALGPPAPAEFAAGHAAGARNIPLGQLEASKDLPSNKKLPIVLLCASGARAGRAAGLLRKAGYENVVAVAGGNAAWREAQLPIEKKA